MLIVTNQEAISYRALNLQLDHEVFLREALSLDGSAISLASYSV